MDPQLREEVFRRDHWKCQAHPRDFALDLPCQGRLHAHHVILRSQGGQDIMDHLVTVCERHHDYLHNGDRHGAELAGLILRV